MPFYVTYLRHALVSPPPLPTLCHSAQVCCQRRSFNDKVGSKDRQIEREKKLSETENREQEQRVREGEGVEEGGEHRAVDTVAWQRKLGATSDNKQTAAMATYT